MEVKLPSGCNIYYGTYIDNYNGSTRKRYYINGDGSLVLNSIQGNSSRPSNFVCVSSPIYFHPEFEVTFKFFAFTMIAFAGMVIYQLILKRLWLGR